MARVVRLWQYGAPSGGGSVMNYRPVAGWGRLPEGGSYVEATSVAVDGADNVYVFNRGAHPVIVFDRDGNFLRSWREGIFRRPHGIPIGPSANLWLTDDLPHTPSPRTRTAWCKSPIVRITACRSSTGRGSTSRSSAPCIARAGSSRSDATAGCSTSASCRRTSP